jgi:1,4-alpha-glucan branching enzyme
MSLTKQFLKSKPLCKVTFSLSSDIVADAKTVALVGDFNSWDASAQLLKKQKDGSYRAIVELETGKEFQFRYVLNQSLWLNDSDADKFVPSGVSADENSVVVL